MNVYSYVGHDSQLCSVEQVRLIGGKGDGMRLLQIRNAAGMECTICTDRCADISRLIFKGVNVGFFSPCGYVAPCYYDDQETGFLKSFTAGFLTTCGLTAVGNPCEDEGERLPMHGNIGNTPCERVWWTEDENYLYVHARISDGAIFARKLYMMRTITIGKWDNQLIVNDVVENRADRETPLMLMYHINIGYPLLSEHSKLEISSVGVKAENAHAAKDVDSWAKILPPTPDFEEQCYFHMLAEEGKASVYNPCIRKGLTISFDPKRLDHFTQWKMMGVRDYALGLEPGNCYPSTRDAARRQGILKFLKPGESNNYQFVVTLYEK